MIEDGEVERGWLGVGVQTLTPEMAESFKVISASAGVLVNSVDEGTPADKAGLQRGDIIVAYDGKAIAHPRHLQNYVADTDVGKDVRIKILREGLKKTLTVRVGKHL